MAAVSISFSFFLLCLGHVASCSGTFYRKVSDDEDDAEISTRGFHQCSLINNCKIVGIPVADASSKVYSAATMQELENVGEKLGIWKKAELEDSKESVEGKNNILMRTKIKSDELLCQEVERHWAISKDVYDNNCIVQK